VASGSPVALKRDIGEGYSVQVSLPLSENAEKTGPPTELLQQIRTAAPLASMSLASPHQPLYHLKSKDTVVVDRVLQLLDTETEKYGITSYDVLGTSIEDIFLELMRKEDIGQGSPEDAEAEKHSTPSSASIEEVKPVALNLATGRATSPLRQALTIFYKRSIIFRRSWLTPLLAVVIAIAGTTIPLVFISGRSVSCVKTLDIPGTDITLFPPTSPLLAFYLGPQSRVLDSPSGILSSLGNLTALSSLANLTALTNITDLGNTTALVPFSILDVADNATFVNTIKENFLNITTGGVSFDLASGNSLVAWEASAPGLMGPTMLNLASNILFNHALNTSGRAGVLPSFILPTYESFPPVDGRTLSAYVLYLLT
jgi:ATP-binding cassette subfamily A (ABC1) protein 3